MRGKQQLDLAESSYGYGASLDNYEMNEDVIDTTVDEQDFRALAENIPILCWMANPDGWIAWYNRRWYEFTGTTPAQMEGWGWQSVHDPERLPEVLTQWQSSIATGQPFVMTFPLRAADGTYRPFLTRAAPIRDETGRIQRWYGVNTDISEQIAAEEALRASEGQFRAFAQAVPNHVWAGSADGRLYWFNDQVYAYSGVAPGDLDGIAWTEIVHPDDLPAAAEAWGAALLGGTVYETEFRIRRADGAFHWFLVRAEPTRDAEGVVTGWVGTNTDIHDQKLTQAKLSLFNETLEQEVAQRTADRDRMWRLSTDIMLVARYDATIEAVNPAWTTLLGWSETDLLGRAFMDLVHPDDVAPTLAEVGKLSQGLTTLRFENRYRRQDGQYCWLSWTAVPAEDLIHAVGRDITTEKEAAEALARAEDQLRQAQKMEAVGQLTGGVAHDFNNLLTVMKSSTDLLRRPDLPEERRQRYITAISETVDRAAKLTSQLLAFARRQTLQPIVFDAGSGIEALTEMMATLTGSRIEIVTDLPDTPCFVSADPSQFDTAIVNMAVNARDAMRGEGRLTLSVHPVSTIPAVRAHPPISGDFVAVCVEDTGSGIASGDIERVFEPFFTTKEVGQGTGLGLSQVFGFAKQSGGEIRVQSEVGQGTMFVLYLPRVEAKAGQPVMEPEPLIDGHGTSVLLVEDNAEVGAFATQTLAELGYRTVWVSNAEMALVELANDAHSFDVVFTDVVMPGMNGIDLAKEIRRRHGDLPVVLTSGYSHVLAQEGTNGFELLHKPSTLR